MHLPKNLALKLIGFAFLMGLAAWVYFSPGRLGLGWGSDGVSPVVVSTTDGAPAYALHILFIGNSYTYVHDIPGQVAKIASSDPGNPTQYTIQSVTMGAKVLRDLWKDGRAAQLIQRNHWDYVVLQENSFWAMGKDNIEDARDYFTRFDGIIRKSGARTMLYLTWPRKPGSGWYSDPKYSFLRDPQYMLQRFITQTYDLAGKIGAPVAPVGYYWGLALSQAPNIELYESDAHHPSAAGAYLAGLVFYKTFSGRDVTKILYRPDEVSDSDADKLKAIVAQPMQ